MRKKRRWLLKLAKEAKRAARKEKNMATLPRPVAIKCPFDGETRHILVREFLVGLAADGPDTYRRTEQPRLTGAVYFVCGHVVENVQTLIRGTQETLLAEMKESLARDRATAAVEAQRRAAESAREEAGQRARDEAAEAAEAEARQRNAAEQAQVAAADAKHAQEVYEGKLSKLAARSRRGN
ncbi:MAG TPA: hypothetical protein VLT62_14035 [Candidatus Methylomirabilis sp.]|nr:hypothetical protein [Candidatus Methylomirabilis sp.]